jgi:hypothetical protein
MTFSDVESEKNSVSASSIANSRMNRFYSTGKKDLKNQTLGARRKQAE